MYWGLHVDLAVVQGQTTNLYNWENKGVNAVNMTWILEFLLVVLISLVAVSVGYIEQIVALVLCIFFLMIKQRATISQRLKAFIFQYEL